MRVCVIDDNPLMLSHIEEMLTGLGHDVVTASDVDTGLRCAETQPSDIAVVDILMPERDGLNFIMEIRQRRPGIRVIAISGGGGLGAGALLSMASGLGAQATLVKPFSATDLALALQG